MRKYRDINIDAFKLDIENSLSLPVHERSPETYNSKIRLLVEQHAPLLYFLIATVLRRLVNNAK
jgi:hypothetical protein